MGFKKYLIGNWKSNKTEKEVIDFFEKFSKLQVSRHPSGGLRDSRRVEEFEAVICPSFVHLEVASKLIKELNLPLKLGAQDISHYGEGAYTGEVNGRQLKEYISYCIIGHSERRSHFQETDSLLKLKAEKAKELGIKTIFCVPDDQTSVSEGVSLIAYEPVFAIGTGKSDTPENAARVIKMIKEKTGEIPVIYGGSVTADNINHFLKMPGISGVLPGKASLDPDHFFRMLINAAI